MDERFPLRSDKLLFVTRRGLSFNYYIKPESIEGQRYLRTLKHVEPHITSWDLSSDYTGRRVGLTTGLRTY